MGHPYHYTVRCEWCEGVVDDNGSDYRNDDDGHIYHFDCFSEMEAELRAEQYAKHAPDNMEVA
jgi:hypothetical protein